MALDLGRLAGPTALRSPVAFLLIGASDDHGELPEYRIMTRLTCEKFGPFANDAPYTVPLITTIAATFRLALVLGFVAARLTMPSLVGYLAAGILIGPRTPGFVADINTSPARSCW